MLEPVALGIVRHLEQRLEFPPLRGLEVLQDEVLPQLQAYNFRFRMVLEERHERVRCGAVATRPRSVASINSES